MMSTRPALRLTALAIAAMVTVSSGGSAHAEGVPGASRQFVMKDVLGPSALKECAVQGRSVVGAALVRCPDSRLALIFPSGKRQELASSNGPVTFTATGEFFVNARGMVATAGECSTNTVNGPEVTNCHARWDAAGKLSVISDTDQQSMNMPAAMNIHGDVVTMTIGITPEGGLSMGTIVWWANGKREQLQPTKVGASPMAFGITDARDIYGSETTINYRARGSSRADLRACLLALKGDPTTLAKGVAQICGVESSAPVRWKQGQRPQRLKGLPGAHGTGIDVASPSGNHLVGTAMTDSGLTPVHWGGVNDAPTVMENGLNPQGLQIASFVDNHHNIIFNELHSDGAGFRFKSVVMIDNVPSDLSTSVIGLPDGAMISAQNIDKQGNIFAQILQPLETDGRWVLLQPTKK